jgi:hypothetical protein
VLGGGSPGAVADEVGEVAPGAGASLAVAVGVLDGAAGEPDVLGVESGPVTGSWTLDVPGTELVVGTDESPVGPLPLTGSLPPPPGDEQAARIRTETVRSTLKYVPGAAA